MTTTTLNVTPITENFQTCKPALLADSQAAALTEKRTL